MVWTGAAVGFVVVVAAASLLTQSPITNPIALPARSLAVAVAPVSSGASSVGQAPLANLHGNSYWISSDADRYDIKSGTASCVASDGSCAVPSGAGQTIGSVTSDMPVSAVIAPDADRAAVWTADKVVILPLTATPATVSIDQLTPRPTVAATVTPVPVTPVPVTPVPITSASVTPAPATAAPVPTASSTSGRPTATFLPLPTAALTQASRPSPVVSTTTQPIAILSGYEIVGSDPEFSPDGTMVAFSARPMDHSTGPDLFVWQIGQQQATAVTLRHSDIFAGWYGSKILVSEISPVSSDGAGQALPSGYNSFVFDPATGDFSRIDRPMLLPAVDPTSQYLVYWVGSVEFDQASGLWQPGRGDLYFDSWSDIALVPTDLGAVAGPSSSPGGTPEPSPMPAEASQSLAPAMSSASDAPVAQATPGSTDAASSQAPASPTLPQLLPAAATAGAVGNWIVRWDTAGQHVAIWVADPNSTKIGRLDLFSVNPITGLVDTNEPLLAADKVLSSVFFDDAGRLVYTSAVDGKTYMQAVPAVPPSSASTPTATTPGQQASGAVASTAAQASTRPGN
jgi:hypothetical protein